jgi:hypothetical protein
LKLKLNDKVKILRNNNRQNKNSIGTIVGILIQYKLVCVQFDYFTNGHNGFCGMDESNKGNKEIHSRWNFFINDVEKIDDQLELDFK